MGRDRGEIARITKVPEALLELIVAELDSRNASWERVQREHPVEVKHAQQIAGTRRMEQLALERRQRTRRLPLTVVIIELAAVANVAACATSFIGQHAALGVLTAAVSVALIVVVWMLSRATAHPGTGN